MNSRQPRVHATEEQERIVYSTERRVLVNARAGCGKTQTLQMYAEERPRDRCCFLAFNKPVQLAAARRMPANTRCFTTHGLCWPTAVKLFGGPEKARAKVGTPYASKLARRLGCSNHLAAAALQTVVAYCASVEEDIGAVHVPPRVDGALDRSAVVDAAKRTWALMLDPEAVDIALIHDGYLKLTQLDPPSLAPRYTILLVDETQDINPSTQRLLWTQKCGLVAVGDPQQQILQFRGSVNGLGLAHADAEFHLTRSFRFGEGIAFVANELLRNLRGATLPIIGAGEYRTTRFAVDRSRPYAFIARTNAAVIAHAIDVLDDKRKLLFVGGLDRYRLSLLEDGYRLRNNDFSAIRDPDIRSFRNFDDLLRLADETADPELSFVGNAVIAYGDDIPELAGAIRGKVAGEGDRDVITLSTCHKAKGMEFDDVVMADDFAPLVDKSGAPLRPDAVPDEDCNLMYVAVTRARRSLHMATQLVEWLKHPRIGALAKVPGLQQSGRSALHSTTAAAARQ